MGRYKDHLIGIGYFESEEFYMESMAHNEPCPIEFGMSQKEYPEFRDAVLKMAFDVIKENENDHLFLRVLFDSEVRERAERSLRHYAAECISYGSDPSEEQVIEIIKMFTKPPSNCVDIPF